MKNGISVYRNKYMNNKKFDTSKDYDKKNNSYINRYNGSIGRIKKRSIFLYNKYNRTPKLYSHSFYNYSVLNNNENKRKNSMKSLYTENSININRNFDILDNLNSTLQSTERIKHKYLKRRKHKKNNIPDKLSNSYIISSSFNNNFTQNLKLKEENNKYENINETKYDDIDKEKIIYNKLNLQKDNLMEINSQIKLENIILETEINNYKKQYFENENIFNKNYSNFSHKNFDYLNYIKSELKSSISNNSKIIEKIFEIQESNLPLNEKIKKLCLRNENIFKKIEKKNREYAEIQALNEENEKLFNSLKEKMKYLTLKQKNLNMN